MKAYGVEVEEWPDVADIHVMGAKSSVGRLTHHGENRGYFRNKDRKARIRRFWKKKARRAAREEIRESV